MKRVHISNLLKKQV